MDFFLIFIQLGVKGAKKSRLLPGWRLFFVGNLLGRQFFFFPLYLCYNRLYGLVQALLK